MGCCSSNPRAQVYKVPDLPTGKHTLINVFQHTVERNPKGVCMKWLRDDTDGKLSEITWGDAFTKVKKMATCLKDKHGLEKGKRVLIMNDCGPESFLIMLAIAATGAAFVLREPRLDAATTCMMVDLTEPTLIITQPKARSGIAKNAPENVKEWLEEGKKDAEKYPTLAKEELPEIISDDVIWSADVDKSDEMNEFLCEPDDIIMMVTTSGTTGKPKAVMHSQEAAFLTSLQVVSTVPDQVGGSMVMSYDAGFISYTMVHQSFVGLGLTMVFMEKETLRSFLSGGWPAFVQPRPTIMLLLADSVSRLYKLMHEKIEKKGGLAKKMMDAAIAGRAKFSDETNSMPAGALGPLSGLAGLGDKIVGKKIRNAFGGSITTVVTGAAKVDEDAIRFFHGFNIRVLEVYASTEGLITTANSADSFMIGTVGKVITASVPNLEEKDITEVEIRDGKIYIKGKTIFKGYYNLQKKTDEVLKDGWYDTGDLGEWVDFTPPKRPDDNLRHLKITGSDGRRFPLSLDGLPHVWPEVLESYCLHSEYVKDACMIGVKKKFLTAIINKSPDHDDAKLTEEFVLKDLWRILEEKKISTHEYPMRIIFEKADITRTPTGKNLKRDNVEADPRYKERVDKAYEDADKSMVEFVKQRYNENLTAHH
eukprot:m.9664 g.9664  ORF g.9664 m.9664 type:complete len:649 (+) comp4111_c0_seq1:194-2140(+)